MNQPLAVSANDSDSYRGHSLGLRHRLVTLSAVLRLSTCNGLAQMAMIYQQLLASYPYFKISCCWYLQGLSCCVTGWYVWCVLP